MRLANRRAPWSASSQATRSRSAQGSALTLPSRGRPTSGFACCRPPLMSNVRAQQMHGVGLLNGSVVSRLSLCGLGSVVSLLFVPGLVAARSLGSIFAAVLGSPQSRAVPFSGPRLPGEHEQVHRQSRQRPTGAHAVPVQVRLTSALRADVLRRAVSSLSRCAAGLVLPSTRSPCHHSRRRGAQHFKRAVRVSQRAAP